MANFCRNCNAQLADNAPFCNSCGTPVQQGQQFQQQGPVPGQQFPQQQYQQQVSAPGQQFPQQDQQYPQQQFQQQGQVPQQQFPLGQQGPTPQQGPPVPPQPKKILGLTTKQLMIIGGAAAVVIIGVILLIVLLGGNSYESLEYFDVGGDMVPSVFYVLGEKRSISNVDTSSSKKSEKMVIQYSVDKKQGDDMEEYAQALVDDFDFVAMDEYDFSGKSGKKFEFVKVSDEDDDFIVSVSIDFDSKGYKLTITRQEGTVEANGAGGAGDTDKPGDDNVDTPYDIPPLTENDVDLIVPKFLAGGMTLDEVRANAPDGVAVVEQKSDGSYIFRMSKDRQQALLEESEQKAIDVLDSVFDFDWIIIVAWNPTDFSSCSVVAEQPFFEADNNVNYNLAIMSIALTSPMVQVYMGMGLESITSIELVNDDSGESKVITSEEFLEELFG